MYTARESKGKRAVWILYARKSIYLYGKNKLPIVQRRATYERAGMGKLAEVLVKVNLANTFGNGEISMNIGCMTLNRYTTHDVDFKWYCLYMYIATGEDIFYAYGTTKDTIRKNALTHKQKAIEENERKRREWEEFVAYRKSL